VNAWYIYGRGGTQIIRDIDVRDGLAAKYNLIVLGGPLDNVFTKKRESEGTSSMCKFDTTVLIFFVGVWIHSAVLLM
jgi:3-phosphoglycerate kinase